MLAPGLGRLANDGNDSRPASSRAHTEPPGGPTPNGGPGGPGWETIELGAAAQTLNPAAPPPPPRSPLLERGNRLPDERIKPSNPDPVAGRKGALARAESVLSAVTAGPMPWDGPAERRDAEDVRLANGPPGKERRASGDVQAKAWPEYGHIWNLSEIF